MGAYKTTNGNKSASGVSLRWESDESDQQCSNAKAKGTGWGIIDIAALSAIQMLILVEFANNNVQSVIGRGYCDSNSSARHWALVTMSVVSRADLPEQTAG